ncbi:hypothetical protein NL676_017684 [Syzygium grande]|nr:hypothetical protein NL676_017684 [Syzygium grande]
MAKMEEELVVGLCAIEDAVKMFNIVSCSIISHRELWTGGIPQQAHRRRRHLHPPPPLPPDPPDLPAPTAIASSSPSIRRTSASGPPAPSAASHEFAALSESGVTDVTGVELINSPPLYSIDPAVFSETLRLASRFPRWWSPRLPEAVQPQTRVRSVRSGSPVALA